MDPSEKSKEKAAAPSSPSPQRTLSEQPLKPILKCSRHPQQMLRTKRAMSVPPMRRPSRRLFPSVSLDTTICFVLSRRASLETPVCYTLSSSSNTELCWVMSMPPPQMRSNRYVSRMPRVAAREYEPLASPRRASTGSVIQMVTPPLIYTFNYDDITTDSWVSSTPPPLVTVSSSGSDPMNVCPVYSTIIADAPPVILGTVASHQEAPPTTEVKQSKSVTFSVN